MPRRRRRRPVDWLIGQIDSQLHTFNEDREGLSLREKVRRLVQVYHNVKDLGVNVVREHGWAHGGSRERIRLYLVEYAGVVIEGPELEVVSGISEYGRRIRELRKEEGYHIASGASADPDAGIELRPDQYLLVSPEPDVDAARRWHIANRIRRSAGGAKQHLLRYLQENVGRVVTTEELAYVARNAKQFARRVRELRTEEGYAIATRFTGKPDLRLGEYLLQSLDRVAEAHDRRIPSDVQRVVYARDDNTCRVCGWNMSRWTDADPRILELHHIEHHVNGGANVPENLMVICSRCHDNVHAGRLTLPTRSG